MMLRRSSPDVLTVSGLAPASSTTSEQVASKPMPLTAEGGSAASAIAARTEAAHAAQISEDDCSTTLPASCQTVIECRAVANSVPFSSNTPARALDVPTSTPMKACLIPNPVQDPRKPTSRYSPHRRERRSRSSGLRHPMPETGRRMRLRRPPHSGHRRTADPGIIHLRIVLDECIKGGGDVGRRHGIDADAAGTPLRGEGFREMVHRGLRGVVVALLLRFVDDEA